MRVARGLTPWFDEYRAYHRKDGKFVQSFCDLMDATRTCVVGYKQMRGREISYYGMTDRHDEELMARPWDPWAVASY